MYVIELGHGIEERYTHKHRTHLYVGQTQNTVSRRMRSNLTRADRKTVVSLDEARESPGGDDWRFTSPGSKKIRAHYVRHRPDLYAHLNPIEKDESRLKEVERELSRKLSRVRKDGRLRYQIHGDGKKRRRRRKKSR